MSDQILITVEDAARRLAIGRSAMYELLASGQIARVKIGRSTRVPLAALLAWVERLATANGYTDAGTTQIRAISDQIPASNGESPNRRRLREVV